MINYTNTRTKNVNDGFSQIMREASESFENDGLNIFGEGFKEIIADEGMFSKYADEMLTGVNAEDEENLRILVENSRMQIVQEGALGGISPVASLSIPTLRKSWARLAIPKAYDTEPVEDPKFKISYMVPWIRDTDGTKWELPEHLDKIKTVAERLALSSSPIVVGGSEVINLFTGKYSAGGDYAGGALSVGPGDAIDSDLRIITVVGTALDAGGLNGEAVSATVDWQLNTDASVIRGVASFAHSDTTVTSITVMAVVDREIGTITIMGVGGNVVSIVVEGYIASTMNNQSISTGFDVRNKDVDIPTGVHIDAPVPTEYLTDLLKQYNVNGVTKVIDVMSNVLSQKVEAEGIAFLDRDIATSSYTRTFSAKPVGAFTGSPTEWKQEIKGIIDHMAGEMINDTHFENGFFVVLGNPLDTALVPGVDWTFVGSNTEMAGVRVGFSTGEYQGAYSYRVVSTPNVAQGQIKLVYIPLSEDQMTYKYFPYSFTIENSKSGYVSPNSPHVPSITASRRQKFERIIPLVGKIVITNNAPSEYNHTA